MTRWNTLPAGIKLAKGSIHKGTGRPATPGQDALEAVMRERYGSAIERDYKGAVPGRKFEVDVAHVDWRMGFEIDGYRSHGLSLSGWRKDREKDRWMLLSGWIILRCTNKEAVHEPERLRDMFCRIAARWGKLGEPG